MTDGAHGDKHGHAQDGAQLSVRAYRPGRDDDNGIDTLEAVKLAESFVAHQTQPDTFTLVRATSLSIVPGSETGSATNSNAMAELTNQPSSQAERVPLVFLSFPGTKHKHQCLAP